MLGPYASCREKPLAYIEMVLERIRQGYGYVEAAEEVYLVHLELAEIIKALYPLDSSELRPPFFLHHAEAKGDNWLIEENHVSGFIDWEWAEAQGGLCRSAGVHRRRRVFRWSQRPEFA